MAQNRRPLNVLPWLEENESFSIDEMQFGNPDYVEGHLRPTELGQARAVCACFRVIRDWRNPPQAILEQMPRPTMAVQAPYDELRGINSQLEPADWQWRQSGWQFVLVFGRRK